MPAFFIKNPKKISRKIIFGSAKGAPTMNDYELRQVRKEATVIIFLCVGCYSWCCHFYLK